MRLYIDLGFSGAALLLVLLVGPVVAFVVRQQWRLAATRQAEVRRLALLTAQEAAVAEMEAMASYSATSAAGAYSTYVAKEPSTLPECAVCSVFAAARCSRCKIVRYCCYANAVLQCLIFTRPLTAYLLEGFHSRICSKQEWCFTCELESLVRNAKKGKSPLSPIGILSHLQNIGSKFGHGQQEDAHEFLRYAIEAMQSVCLKEVVAKPDGLLAEETTLIQQTFGGWLQSKLRCARCKGKSERCERMMDLTVEIDGNISTLDEALLRFTSSETLDGENKYKCDRCKSYERARKKLTISEAPNVLTIVLKRFQSDNFCKINKAVQFPEYLDLARYMSGDDKSPVYRLYAIIVHLNVMNSSSSGHYICYVKDRQGTWYEIDDSKVKPVELEVVLSKGAYMLLFSRCLPRAPSSVRKARAHEFVQARKIMKITRDGKGKPGGSSLSHCGEHLYPYRSDLYGHLNDSASDNSSLFDESSTCSTESTKESTTTEDSWEHMFGESDSVSTSSPVRISENYDGFACSQHSSKADVTTPVTDPGRNASSSGREIDQTVVETGSFLYSDDSEHSSNFSEHCRTLEIDNNRQREGNSDALWRRLAQKRTPQTFC